MDSCYILLYIETGGLKIHSDVDIDQSTESMSDIIPSRSIPLNLFLFLCEISEC